MKYKNYFPLPNEIFSLGLSSGEIAVYAFLMYCEDRQSFQCHPSYKTIGEAINMSKNTVKKNVSLLTKKKLIQTEPTKILSKKVRHGTEVCVILYCLSRLRLNTSTSNRW